MEHAAALLEEEWSAIAALADELSAEEWSLPSECPGWDVRDLVAHMIGTERSLLGDPAPPDPGPAAHVHNPVGVSNEAWVVSMRQTPVASLMAEFRDVTEKRIAKLAAMTPEQWDVPGPSPIGQVPYREFMSVRLMDCWVHEQDMRVATGRAGHGGGPVAELAMGRIASAMGFVVGKKAGAPDGAVVRFTIVGAAPRRLDVAMEGGRGKLGDSDESVDATAELIMDSELFWRLGCGRVAGDAALGAGLVTMKGDVELGSAVVRNMAFMI